MKNYLKLKIILVIFFSLILSRFMVDNIFIAHSPKIRKNLGSYLAMKINLGYQDLIAKLKGDYFKKQELEKAITERLKKNLQPITKGVRATSENNYSYVEFNLSEIEWNYVIFTLKDGRKIQVRYPKGTNPPQKESFEE
ncbi:MAG: hypothetical protein KatS3mg092_0402 [Patescibacteria group bacterium]|nr:MAG: hypothetical protein KatS3mg092_0402 [Patescibacteria group bacterium]